MEIEKEIRMITDIIPKPRTEPLAGEGTFRCSGELILERGNFEDWSFRAFEERLKKIDIILAEGGGEPALRILRDGTLGEEEYELTVRPDGVTLKASTGRGVVQGLTTLYESFEGGEIPCFSLTDKPRYRHRGLMLDCVRHFFPAAEVEQVLEEMALVKLNILHWHLSDDQGWRLESRVYPKLNQTGGLFYTGEEIRRIVAFAKTRGIEVIPEIDLPGHTTAILAAYPELSCRGEPVELAKGPGIYSVILCAGKERVYDFLFPLLDEVADLFDSPVIHLGGDEAPKSEWKKCPHCTTAVERYGLEGFEDLQGYFTSRLALRLAAKGKRVRCFNETLKAKKLPENLEIQFWADWEQSDQLESFFDKGGGVVFSDMFSLYFDYPESMLPLEKVYRYQPLIGGRSFAGEPNVLGLEACLWTERVAAAERLGKALFPRLIALAEAAWSGGGDYPDFERRLGGKLKSLAERGVAFTTLADCNPQGEARIAGIKQFEQEMREAMSAGSSMPDDLESMKRMSEGFARGFNLPPEFLSARKQGENYEH
jgi:hexosaminidase